jgi:DNA-binding NarL/FixJ family response regulator
LAITRLARLLDDTGRVTIAGTANNAEAAQAALRTLVVDVAFRRVVMPSPRDAMCSQRELYSQ